MKQLLFIVTALLALGAIVRAEGIGGGIGGGNGVGSGVGDPDGISSAKISLAPYSGPGDVQAIGWKGYWALRAFSLATAGNNAADVRCVTAATTVTIKTLKSGKFDTRTLQSDCPADTYFISKLYDQTGNSNDLTQATTADQPQLVINCINNLPCMQFNGTSDQLTNSGFSQAQPWNMVAGGIRTHFTSTFDVMMSGGTAANPNLGFSSTSGDANFRPGSGNITLTGLTENTWQACEGYGDGASSVVQCGALSAGPTSAGTTALSAVAMGFDTGASEFWLHGQMVEGGIGTFAIQTSVISNIENYWGFASASNENAIVLGIP